MTLLYYIKLGVLIKASAKGASRKFLPPHLLDRCYAPVMKHQLVQMTQLAAIKDTDIDTACDRGRGDGGGYESWRGRKTPTGQQFVAG